MHALTQYFVALCAVISFFVAFWVCATLHEIHLDLTELNKTIREKQLEIPSPLYVAVSDTKGGVSR